MDALDLVPAADRNACDVDHSNKLTDEPRSGWVCPALSAAGSSKSSSSPKMETRVRETRIRGKRQHQDSDCVSRQSATLSPLGQIITWIPWLLFFSTPAPRRSRAQGLFAGSSTLTRLLRNFTQGPLFPAVWEILIMRRKAGLGGDSGPTPGPIDVGTPRREDVFDFR